MRIHDLMPSFARFVDRADARVSHGSEGPMAERARDDDIIRLFESEYVRANEKVLRPLIEDLAGWSRPMTDSLAGFSVERARRMLATYARRGYPDRAHRTVAKVEELFGRTLDADMCLFAAFGRIDGYARFDRGRHVVYIGCDYPEPDDAYLDLIIAHETGHVVREGNPATWTALGGSIDMSHDEFTERCPFEEHMVGEGLSTALSEAIWPGRPLHEYLYFTPEQHAWCVENHAAIREGLRRFHGTCEAHYSLYGLDAIAPGSPERTQYYFGWMAVRKLVFEAKKDLRELYTTPAKEILRMAGEL